MTEHLASTDPSTNLLSIVIKQRDDGEVRLVKAIVVRQRCSQTSGADDADAMRLVETENLRDVFAQVVDVVTDAAHAKLAKVAQVFPDLRGVQIELFGQRLRRDRLDSGGVKRIQATKVNTQAARLLVLIFSRTSLGAEPVGGKYSAIGHDRS